MSKFAVVSDDPATGDVLWNLYDTREDAENNYNEQVKEYQETGTPSNHGAVVWLFKIDQQFEYWPNKPKEKV